jgi:hypothetical protein
MFKRDEIGRFPSQGRYKAYLFWYLLIEKED